VALAAAQALVRALEVALEPAQALVREKELRGERVLETAIQQVPDQAV
jgi:hypothetical protein